MQLDGVQNSVSVERFQNAPGHHLVDGQTRLAVSAARAAAQHEGLVNVQNNTGTA